MLHEFVRINRDAIIVRATDRASSRAPSGSGDELDSGVPVFLAQLSETLRLEATATPFAAGAIGCYGRTARGRAARPRVQRVSGGPRLR